MDVWIGVSVLRCKVSARQFYVVGKCALLCNAAAVARAKRIYPIEAAVE